VFPFPLRVSDGMNAASYPPFFIWWLSVGLRKATPCSIVRKSSDHWNKVCILHERFMSFWYLPNKHTQKIEMIDVQMTNAENSPWY
jgi:hypothetical protein